MASSANLKYAALLSSSLCCATYVVTISEASCQTRYNGSPMVILNGGKRAVVLIPQSKVTMVIRDAHEMPTSSVCVALVSFEAIHFASTRKPTCLSLWP
ncbi:hypothetical protein PanWU01x14_114080 [Parasponia andersonii]|uniref:Secreted protein n=1 Tax=Parasponia andersonii TaxID=3476 RepID=A0A2P5CXZ7_PARAD|nr:hypothetical protein PanWU01x14_114080 [Parasponia andersonii]